MAEEWESWASIVRSCVLTSKTPLTPYEINRDTKMLEGKDIPYRRLNFHSLEDMLKKISGLRVFSLNGKTVVQAVASEETAHIQKMVRLQKSSKKKPRTLPPRFNSYNRPNAYRPSTNNRNVPYGSQNRYSVQNRFNVQSNRQSSTEPQRRPSSQQSSYSASSQRTPPTTPVPQQSARSPQQPQRHTQQSPRTPPPLLPTPPSSRTTPPPPLLATPPSSSRTPTSQLPTPPSTRTPPPPLLSTAPPQKSVHFAPTSNIQQRLTSAPSVQQRLATPPQQSAGLLGPAPASVPHQRATGSISDRLNVAAGIRVSQATPSSIDDPRLKLNNYCEARGLPLPVYKDMPTKNNCIFSAVTVDSKKYRSYPAEAKTKEEAEKLAAKAALKELIGMEEKPIDVTANRDLVTKRILDIVNDHSNGLFQSSVETEYKAKYNECLPKDWIKLVERTVTVDVAANNEAILRPQNCDAHGRASPVTLLEPENIKLHELEEFWLHVYVAYYTTDIWGVIIDENHSDKIDELAQEMKIHYDEEESRAASVAPGKFYAVFDSEWHRVRCIKLDEETKAATVFFIDRGDEDVFSASRLRVLHPKFCRLPAQSVRLSLAGLEIFENCEKAQTLLEELLVDKSVFVRSAKNNERFREDRYASVFSAELFLERDDEDVNGNELIRNEIFNKIVNPLVFLGPEKVAQEVHISSVNKNAIFVQLKSPELKLLEALIKNSVKDLNLSSLRPVLRFDPTKMYLVNIHDDWLRVKIAKVEDESTAQVFCVDVGNTITVKRNQLFLLEDLSEMLTLYPQQAVHVRLHKISPLTFDEKMANRLRVLAPKTDSFYMKVVGEMENILMVEFYKRTEENLLASLNDTLALEPEITSRDDNNNAKPRMRNDRSSIGARPEFPLKTPSIPSVGSFFDVHITMAAHPGNFTIQPFKTVHELESLMTELAKFCENYSGPPLTPSSLKVGNMYAAKYDDDGRWYRAYVSKIISKTVCAVYFCDYGDYRAVSLEQLRPLENRFYDLPYQAIKAKLYGVTPKLKGDWTVKDSLRFSELIVTKNFVSMIKSCEMENSSTAEMILGLELIDTSTAEDIYITNVLVNENRADKTE